MSYPPQQPGQPGQFGQSSYQGLGSYSGGQAGPGGPGKRNTGKIVAIVVIAVLVLGGGGVATYFLTRDSGSDNTSSDQTNRDESKDTRGDETPSDDASPDRDQEDGSDDDAGATNSPDDVRDDYMAAYENKDFADVVDSACRAYKTKFGTDTSELETKLEGYDISASPDGEAEIDSEHPDTASAKIDLTLVGDGQTQEPKILIKIVQESGEWRFCGEGTA